MLILRSLTAFHTSPSNGRQSSSDRVGSKRWRKRDKDTSPRHLSIQHHSLQREKIIVKSKTWTECSRRERRGRREQASPCGGRSPAQRCRKTRWKAVNQSLCTGRRRSARCSRRASASIKLRRLSQPAGAMGHAACGRRREATLRWSVQGMAK